MKKLLFATIPLLFATPALACWPAGDGARAQNAYSECLAQQAQAQAMRVHNFQQRMANWKAEDDASLLRQQLQEQAATRQNEAFWHRMDRTETTPIQTSPLSLRPVAPAVPPFAVGYGTPPKDLLSTRSRRSAKTQPRAIVLARNGRQFPETPAVAALNQMGGASVTCTTGATQNIGLPHGAAIHVTCGYSGAITLTVAGQRHGKPYVLTYFTNPSTSHALIEYDGHTAWCTVRGTIDYKTQTIKLHYGPACQNAPRPANF